MANAYFNVLYTLPVAQDLSIASTWKKVIIYVLMTIVAFVKLTVKVWLGASHRSTSGLG